MKKNMLAVAVTGLLMSGLAQAAAPDNSWYAGGKMGWSNFYGADLNPTLDAAFSGKTSTDSDGLGVGALVGYQLNPNVGFELGYDWLGEYQIREALSDDSAKVKAQMVQATMRLLMPVNDRLDFYGRLGGAFAWTNNKVSLGSYSDSGRDSSPAFVGALGAEYAIDNNWAARLEYQYTTPLGDADASKSAIELDNGLLAVGMVYRFGAVALAPVPVAAPVAPAPAQVTMQKHFTLNSDVLFEFDSARLKPAASGELDRLFEQLVAANPKDGTARVMGFTDRLGSDEYNQRLSEQRAQSVADYLVGKGLVAGKVIAEGHGEQNPVTAGRCQQAATKALIACLAPDRRVEISLEGVGQE